MPSFPPWGFALAILGGLWMLLWQTRWRRAGAVPLMIGIAALLAAPRPDLLVTGDGRHIAAAQPDGSYALLRDPAGASVRDLVAATAGIEAPLWALAALDHVESKRDFSRRGP